MKVQKKWLKQTDRWVETYMPERSPACINIDKRLAYLIWPLTTPLVYNVE